MQSRNKLNVMMQFKVRKYGMFIRPLQEYVLETFWLLVLTYFGYLHLCHYYNHV